MRRTVAVVVLMGMSAWTAGAERALVAPYEAPRDRIPETPLDAIVAEALAAEGIEPAPLCSDPVFLRRLYLDVTGQLPHMGMARQFLQQSRPGQRAWHIDHVLDRPEYAQYWTLKWGDVLRIKAEFPINLWPNAVQAYERWVYESLRDNMPYDQFVRALLTSSGSNFREPPVNFYRAIQGQSPEAMARAVALTFMGLRLEDRPEAEQAAMAAFFSRVAFKRTAEWKEEVVYVDPEATEPIETVFPDGAPVTIRPGVDPRVVFADWLIAPDNPWFARNYVNRAWSWLMGRGIVHEPDDVRDDNPPSNPALLWWLEREFVESGYDMKHLFRVILNSRTYQQSALPASDHPKAEALFAHYAMRQLDAEVLLDALNQISGQQDEYESAIPEPFTYVPPYRPTVALADGSITSPFLELFGRPPRDTGLESERTNTPTESQRLHMLNSSQVREKIERSFVLHRLYDASDGDNAMLIRGAYMSLLTRPPTADELAAAQAHFTESGLKREQAAVDLAWALVNSKEFLCRH